MNTTPAVVTPAVVTPAVVTPAVVTPAVVTPAVTPAVIGLDVSKDTLKKLFWKSFRSVISTEAQRRMSAAEWRNLAVWQ